MGALSTTYEVADATDLVKEFYFNDLRDARYTYFQHFNKYNGTIAKDFFDDAQVRVLRPPNQGGGNDYYYFRDPGCAIYCFATDNYIGGTIASNDAEAADAFLARLEASWEPHPPLEDNKVRVRFWMMGSQGAGYRSRALDVPSWKEVRQNYSQSVQETLDTLMSHETWDPRRGKLVLWRGEPGGGKTFALRALIREWSKWSVISYILDPEVLLGGNPSYLLDVCMEDQSDDEMWRLLILEDSGELLGADARQKTGQGLSRLLNVVDGFIGQGLKVLILVTTNEDFGRLHKAVSREGRCALNLEFGPLSTEECNTWLINEGIEETVSKATPLADLYAKKQGRAVNSPTIKKEGLVGFATSKEQGRKVGFNLSICSESPVLADDHFNGTV